MVELPDRKEISLCEAVTAVIYGNALDVNKYQLFVEDAPPSLELQKFEEQIGLVAHYPANKRIASKEQIAGRDHLLDRLREAAYGGRVKLRGRKDGEGGFKDIDPLYFQHMPAFNWWSDEICRREDELSPVWHFVHLDREQFQWLLKEMGLEPEQREDADPTSRTGVQGRPPSIHLFIPEAESRMNAEQHPDTLAAFGRELAEWFKQTHVPSMPRLQPRSIENALRKHWHAHKKVCTK